MLRLKPFLDQLTIKTTSNDFRKLDLEYVDPDPTIGDWGWAQRPYVAEIERQYNRGQPVRIIVLKARQLGISTATEACLFLWCFFHRGSNGLVLSYEDGQAQELFQMTKTYWDKWPHRHLYTLQYSTKRQLRWLETSSQVRVATAKNAGGVRGSTVHALHASEVAFWADPDTLWTGMKQTIPNRHKTIVVLESTANGIGNFFHNTWLSATEGESEFVAMFFPWYLHPAYRMATTLCTKLELDADERRYFRLFTQPTKLGETYAPALTQDEAYQCVAWRRWGIINQANGDLLSFMQEYPATAEEAFISTGKPIFSPLHLLECFDEKRGVTGRFYRDSVGRVQFVEDPAGEVTLYKRPPNARRSDRFFVAGDPSETIPGDPACIQAIDRKTLEQVAVWHGRTTPIHFAKEMILMGDFYHHAMLCPEVEGGGQACIGYMIASGYDNLWLDKRADRIRGSSNVYGWSTNWQRKQWCVGFLQRLIIDHSLLIHDRKTYNQMQRFVEHENGEWGNADAKIHDDSVMALAIAVTASDREGPFVPDSVKSANPYLDLYRQTYEDEADDIYAGANYGR